jgi:Uma2 family endonuclease
MRTVTGLFTRADYELLPEGFPAQLIDGWLVKDPGQTYGHQSLAGRLHARLGSLVGLDRVLFAPIDVGVDEHNVYQPDIVVLRRIPGDHEHDVGIPLLAVEVLSPSTADRDRFTKCPHLLSAGVAEVWLVDAATKSVERHDASGQRVATGQGVISSNVVPGFDVVPDVLFAPPR